MNNYSFPDIYVGQVHSFRKTIEPAMMTDFLNITGDNNPLHTDIAHAKEHGFSEKVVYGLLTSAFYSTLVGVYLPGKYCILQGIEIQFLRPVYVGDTIDVTGVISYINKAYKQLEIKALVKNQNNIKVSKATIKTGVLDA